MLARVAWPLLALCAGIALVTGYDRVVGGARYGYSSDSASYVEMAESLARGEWPSVVPWGPELASVDEVAQPLFPPGFPLLASLAAPLAGTPRLAVAMVPRLCAALLPLVLLLSFRRLASDALLLATGVAVLCTQGVLYWHYIGYSDVPGLLLAVAALGLSWQATRRSAQPASAVCHAAFAGLLSGACYGVRNAGLAVIVAGAAYWIVEAWREPRARGAAWAWLAGLVPQVIALKLYNVVAFGLYAPYSMPASTRGWRLNLADWVSAQIMDLQLRAPDAQPLTLAMAATVLAIAILAGLAALLAVRRKPTAGAVRLLLGYVAVGGAMVVVSRSRYEWGGTIDSRHALQYTFALLLVAAAVAQSRAQGTRARTVVCVLAWCGVAAIGGVAATTAVTEAAQPEQMQVLVSDPDVMAPVRALTADTWLVSNEAVLFRIELGRAARQSDFGGDDQALLAHLDSLQARVLPRPVAFVLVCDEWTVAISGCGHVAAVRAPPPCVTLRSPPPRVLLCRSGGRVAALGAS